MQPAAYFAFPSGKAVPIQNGDLFKGKTFYVRCDFPDLYLAQFIKDIEVSGVSHPSCVGQTSNRVQLFRR